MATRKKKPARKKKTTKPFTFQLGWTGIAGVTVVTLCLFLWMFFLGVWAGQTILFPSGGVKKIAVQKTAGHASSLSLQTVTPRDRKKAVKGED